jgi:hypothetical protein
MEILFKATSFPNTLNTLMGIEGNYLLRLVMLDVPSNHYKWLHLAEIVQAQISSLKVTNGII